MVTLKRDNSLLSLFYFVIFMIKQLIMGNFFREMFTDENGVVSTKRIAGMLCVIGLVTSLIANTFSHGDIKPSDALVESVALFAFGALGLTSIDKFTKNKFK